MQPPADVHLAAVADRVVDPSVLDRLIGAPDDTPSCDSRIPSAVSLSFRRALRRVTAAREFSPACDVGSPDAIHALEAISHAVRQVYTRGQCGAVPSGPVALQVFLRLREAFIEEIDALRASLKSGELAEALRAFDLVWEEMRRDETQCFAAALRSGDALDLVVEMAHDMRSPLTAILMLTETGRRPHAARGDGTQDRQLGLVYSAAFGLNGLVNDVIALARGGDRLIERHPVPFSTSALMHSVADMLRPIAADQRLGFRVTTPSVNGRIGQPIALSRVLLNLASNALKYTDVGEVSMTAIDLYASRVRFEVADTGPGIPADAMPLLFQPFAPRLSAPRSRRFSPMGLGLAICRKLLRDMGSELHVESAADRGTRFFFELALPAADEADAEVPSSARAFL